MGSIGIALAATLLTHSEATYHAVLVDRASGPVAQNWIATTMAGLQRLGATAADAQEHALALLESLISRQATVLAYNHIFELVAIMFAVVIPLIFLIPRSGHTEGADVMMD
jgi:DHA2 family multidrug resistance protein